MADESEGWVRVTQGMHAEAIVADRAQPRARARNRLAPVDPHRPGLLAYAYWHLGRRDDAALALAEAFEVAQDIGMRFVGGILLGARALMARDATELAGVVVEAERVLAAGAPAHNHFSFRREAIDASLTHGDTQGALRHAALLEDFTRAEPLSTVDFVVARARALAAAAHGRADPVVLMTLRQHALALHWPGLVQGLGAGV